MNVRCFFLNAISSIANNIEQSIYDLRYYLLTKIIEIKI